MLWNILADIGPPQPKGPAAENDNSLYIYIGAGVAGLILLLILLRMMFGKKGQPDLQKGMREDLAEYPPPPKISGSTKLSFNGVPVRLRLLVLCPTGNQAYELTPDLAGEVLDDLLNGLGDFVDTDKPRVKVWPVQPSVAGFAPTFHRVIDSPDDPGAPSKWILAAGPAKIGGRPILLGMAFLAEKNVKMGQLTLQGKEWQEAIRVDRS